MIAKFFPAPQYPIEICLHKDGKDLTITEQTDSMESSVRYPVEYYGYKHNVRVGGYLGNHFTWDSSDMASGERIGNIRHDVYLNVGAVAPTYAEAIAIIKPWFKNLIGRMPSAVSFAAGIESYALDTINDFLGGRNSRTDESNYSPYNRLVWSNLASTIRWYDQPLTWPQVAAELTTVANAGGWFRDFTHWHNLLTSNVVYKQGEFYQTMNDTLSALGKSAHFCSAGEAIEYVVFRDLITRAVCYESSVGKIRIALEVDNLFLQDRINTPISVKIDLSGTILAGKDILCKSAEVISLGDDQFIVNIPFRIDAKTNKVLMVELEETTGPDYRHFNLPTATPNTVGNVITITSSTPVLATLFRKAKAEAEEKYTLSGRNLQFNTVHTFSGLDIAGNDYKIGISDKFGNLNLI